MKADIEIKLYSEWRGQEEVTLIAVKQYHLPKIIEMLKQYSRGDHTLLFLQNGMGHIKWLDHLKGNLYVGTVEHGAMRTAANMCSSYRNWFYKIAPYRVKNTEFYNWMKSDRDGFFPFEFENHMKKCF